MCEQCGQYNVDNVPCSGMQRGIPEASTAFFVGDGGGGTISAGGGEGVVEAEGVVLSISEIRGERRRVGFGVSSRSTFACVGSGEGEGEAVTRREVDDLDLVGEVRRLLRSRERSPSPYDNPAFSSSPSIFLSRPVSALIQLRRTRRG